LYTKYRRYPFNIAIDPKYAHYCMTIMHIFVVLLEHYQVKLSLLVAKVLSACRHLPQERWRRLPEKESLKINGSSAPG
jgi:hypothetical protein